MREGAKAGTFVEIKNSTIGAGAKVPHLSYVGDADVVPVRGPTSEGALGIARSRQRNIEGYAERKG